MNLDENALRAAAMEYNDSLAGYHFGATERIVRAYLSALPSSPVSELVEELKAFSVNSLMDRTTATLTTLATRNAELEREVKRLREALTPFASEADELAVGVADDCVYALPRHPDLGLSDFDVGDLRAASRALSTSPQGGDHE